MRILAMNIMLLCSVLSYAQKFGQYSVKYISDNLIDNADLVFREYDLHFEILPTFEIKQTVHQVKTILNKSVEEEANLVVYYDKFHRVKNFSATTVDKNGNVIKKLKKTEIFDLSIAGNSVDDSRIKIADMTTIEYPYTVIFDYEVEIDGLFYYPNYTPQFKERVSIQKSSFSIEFPENLKPRYTEHNVKPAAVTPTSLLWEINDLPAFKKIPFSPEITEFVPFVLTAPSEFELDGNKGNMDSWSGFAKWYSELNRNRDQLTSEDIQIALSLTKDLTTKEEKIRAIYEYMQSTTRYVSVQLGIGGYQSMPADEVAKDGWGDCKALSNYTKALLQSVGISAYPALVYAGRGAPNIISDFSSNQFNHVILCVPLEQDTVWLECTSREIPYNFLGAFTGDRDVLFINNGSLGGEIIRTPRYKSDVNFRHRKAIVHLNKDGNGNATIKTIYNGLRFDELLPYLDESEETLEKIWYEKVKIPGYKIDKIGFKYDKSSGPKTELNIDLTLKNYASKSGNRYFFKPNLMNRSNSYPKLDDDRALDVVTKSEYIDIDTIEYKLPEGFHLEHLPENIALETRFGSYSATYLLNEVGLLYIRKVKTIKGVFPKSSFNEYSQMLKKIKRADNQKVVLVGST